MFHFLRASIEDFEAQGRGNTFKEIPAKVVKEFMIPLPPLDTQRAVARLLDCVYIRLRDHTVKLPLLPTPLSEQRRIVERVEELAAKVEKARGLRRQAVAEAEALSNSELSAIFTTLDKQFGSQQLGQVILNANYGTSTKCRYERADNSVPVLRIPNVAGEHVSLSDLKFGNLSESELARVLIPAGDILVVRTNGSADLVGRCAVVPPLPEPTAFASYMIRLRCNPEVVNPEYLQLMLKQLRTNGQLIDFARTTAGQYNVSLGRLRDATLPTPPLAEQHRVVDYLDSLQARIDSLQQMQAKTAVELEALLPSVLDRAFKGRL